MTGSKLDFRPTNSPVTEPANNHDQGFADVTGPAAHSQQDFLAELNAASKTAVDPMVAVCNGVARNILIQAARIFQHGPGPARDNALARIAVAMLQLPDAMQDGVRQQITLAQGRIDAGQKPGMTGPKAEAFNFIDRTFNGQAVT